MKASRFCDGFFGALTGARGPTEDFPQSFDVSLMAADGFFGPLKHPERLEKSSLALSRWKEPGILST